MTRFRMTATTLTAAGLVLAQPATAAARAAAPLSDSEQLADSPGAGAAFGAIAIVALISLLMLTGRHGSEDDRPTSP